MRSRILTRISTAGSLPFLLAALLWANTTLTFTSSLFNATIDTTLTGAALDNLPPGTDLPTNSVTFTGTPPPADQAGFPLGTDPGDVVFTKNALQIGTNASGLITSWNINYTVFASYPAFPGESPNDFFCVYTLSATQSGTSVTLTQDNDAGFCPGGNTAAAGSFGPNQGVLPPSIAKSFGAGFVALNGSTSLSFTITNPNAGTGLTGVAFTDDFPAGLVVATPNGLTGSCDGGVIGAGASSVSLNGATLAGGGSCTFSVNVTGVIPGTKINSVTVTSTNGGTGNTSSVSLMVNAPTVVPPSITKSFGASTIAVNGSTGLTFTITNPNAGTALAGVAFTDTFPAGLAVSTPNGLSGSCGGGTITATAGSSSVSLSGATIAASGNCTFSVNVTGVAAGLQNNSVAVTSTNGGAGNTSTASVTVISPPSITKSFGASTVALNGSTGLTFTITNPNAGTALTGVAFTDTFPAGLAVSTPNGLSGGCGGGTITATAGSSSVTLSGATIAGGGNCAFSVNVTGTTSGVKNNSVAVTSTNGGPGNTSAASVTVVSPPSITKSFGAPSVVVNGSTSLSFTITNPNAGTALTGVAFTDTFPAGLVVSTPSGLTGSCGGGSITATAGSSSVSLSGATIAGGGNCTFSVNVTGSAAGVQNNSVAVTSTNGGAGNTSTATLTVASPPSITKSFGISTIALNGSTSLSFTITNPNAGIALSGVAFTDTFPAGLVVSTPNGLAGSCGGGTITATAGSSSVSLSGATLAGGGNCTFSVNVTGAVAGVQNNSVAVTSTNGGAGNTSSASLTVIAPPSIQKSFGASSFALNGSTSLSFTITNPNAGTALSGVAFTDTLPAGLVVSTPNGLTGSCGGGTIAAIAGSSSVSLSGATVAGGGNCTFSVNVTGTTSGAKNNSVAVSSTNGGAGNTSTATVTVISPPSITKSFGASSVPLNGSTSLSFTITNPNAGAALAGVAFTDTLPAGLIVSTPNGLNGSCGGGSITATAGSLSVSLTGAAIAAGGNCTFSVNVTGVTAGVQNNSVTVTSTNAGGGNTSTATVTVVAAPVITKSFAPVKVIPGGTTTLTLSISNPNSAASVTGIAFTDALPVGTTVSTPNALTNTCGGVATAAAGSGTVSLTGGTIAASSTCAVTVSITGTAEGIDLNSVQVSSTNGGTGNTSQATLYVATTPALSKTFGAVSIGVHNTTVLAFTLLNPNHVVTLTGLQFADSLPPGLVISTPNGLTGSCGGGTIAAIPGSNLITVGSATLAPQASCTFTVNVTSDGTLLGYLTNTTSVVTSNEANPGAVASANLFVGDPFQVSYAANLSAGDSFTNISNSGAMGAALPSGTTATITGAICANIYAFTPDEALVSCCSCPVTPNGLVSLSAKNDLASNTLTPAIPTALVVKLVATLPVGGSCNNSAALVGSASLANGMAGFATTIHETPTVGTYGVTETPYSKATLSVGELSRIGSLCNFILANGSGFGVCRSCRLGGLGAAQQQ